MVRERKRRPESTRVRGSNEVSDPESIALYKSLVMLKTSVRAVTRNFEKQMVAIRNVSNMGFIVIRSCFDKI